MGIRAREGGGKKGFPSFHILTRPLRSRSRSQPVIEIAFSCTM